MLSVIYRNELISEYNFIRQPLAVKSFFLLISHNRNYNNLYNYLPEFNYLMRRDTTSWFSHNLNMEMPIVAYGHAGYPLLMFPTAAADYLEYERFYLIDAIKDFIEERSDSRIFDQFSQQI